MENLIKSAFNKAARNYDAQRKKLIPCFDDFYGIAASAAVSGSEKPSILDIGAGTGLLSSFLLSKYESCSLSLIDVSEEMMGLAKERFSGNRGITYIVDDYCSYEFKDKYDIIASALSIHHLTGPEKKHFYAKCYSLLKPGGTFINADQVMGETEFLENLYKTDWKRKIEASGLSKEELLSAYERTKLDKMSTLSEQLKWLKEAGFKDVDCIYKYFNFVVMLGRKE